MPIVRLIRSLDVNDHEDAHGLCMYQRPASSTAPASRCDPHVFGVDADMQRHVTYLLLAALPVVGSARADAQIGQTAVLHGTVTDASSGSPLPGAMVTVTGSTPIGRSRVTTTDAHGSYRFPAIAPGVYRVRMELQGFKTYTRELVQVQLGQTVSADAMLEAGTVWETITDMSQTPVIDRFASAVHSHLETQVLERVPFRNRLGPAAMLVTPGVNPNNYTAYGGGGASSNAYMIDDVDLSDPEGGTMWVFTNHNWIQEAQIIGLGADAKVGGFSGVASNSLFRSGSDRFSGLFEILYENDVLTGNNVNEKLLEQNRNLTPDTTEYALDSTFQIGGPLKRHRVWFFTGVQYFRPKTSPAGFPPPGTAGDGGPSARLERSPRFLFKPTVRLSAKDTLTGFFAADSYTVDGRGAASTVAPIATVHQDSPEASWNANYRKILGSRLVVDAKYSGFSGYYTLRPYGGNAMPGWYDVADDVYSVNSYYFYNADRARHQVNVTLSRFSSSAIGDHTFTFGVELERSYIKSEYGYPGDMLILTENGVPYGAYFYDGYVKDNINNRTALFAQNQWQLTRRLTINSGVRADLHRGYNRDLAQTVFRTNPVAPRLGAAFDLTGSGRTIVRAHYGHYYDGAKSTYYDAIGPNIAPMAYADIHRVTLGPLFAPEIQAPGTSRIIDADIRHPRLAQLTAGVEREVMPGWLVSATGIWRYNDQFVEDVLQNGMFAPHAIADPGPDGTPNTGDETSSVLTTYRQINAAANNQYLIANPDYLFRRYRGVDFRVKRRYANRWMIALSWVISKIEGNVDNTDNFGNSIEGNDPNQDSRFQPFREGRLERDNTHITKLMGMYMLPFEIQSSWLISHMTGSTFTRTVRVFLPQGYQDLFIEPRGSQRYDNQTTVDLKLQKEFRFTLTGMLGVQLEAFNVFNNAAVISRITRSGSTYFRPIGLVQPRLWRLGLVYRF